MSKERFMQEAINLSLISVQKWGWPFGAVIVKDGEIVWKGHNQVTLNNDPTAHAEVVAIRDACKNLWSFQLDDCELYTSCEPCPMCLWAIYRARPSKVYYGNTKQDAANIGFDDSFIYEELSKSYPDRKIPMIQFMHKEALQAFEDRMSNGDKTEY